MSGLFGVIVLYNPNIEEVLENIASYIDDLDELICIDNSDKKIDVNVFNSNKIIYIYMKKNIGLARALKYGVDYAIKKGAKYVAQFDQDSILEKNALKILLKIIRKDNNIGIVGPNISLIYRTGNKRVYSQEKKFDRSTKDVDWLITSGSILNCDAYIKIGGFDEKLFISGIDRDVCCKMKASNYRIVMCGSCTLYQEAGNTKEVCFFGKKVHPPYLDDKRYYYIFRNELYLRHKHKKTYRNIKTNLFKYLVCILLFENNKMVKIHYVIKGIKDRKVINNMV